MFGMSKTAWRLSLAGVAVTLVSLIVLPLVWPLLFPANYTLGSKELSLLPQVPENVANSLKYDWKKGGYVFEHGSSNSVESKQTGAKSISAVIPTHANKGVTITDPTSSQKSSLIPKFRLASGKQNGGHVVYPLSNNTGWLVYSVQAIGVKEDIVLTRSNSDSQTFKYSLKIDKSLEARLEKDGSIGVYGNTLLSGDITTATEKDAALLQKARQNADKNTLIFRIPKPVVYEYGKQTTGVSTRYKLKGSEIQLEVDNLSRATYPLTIDPSIYVASAEQFMAGNNETNIDFDVANTLIKKGSTTGARFDAWNATTSLPTTTWNAGSTAAGGYLYTIGGTSFYGQIYTTQGASTFTVPAGVTSITVEMWGGGGGGGGGGNTAAGGAGGGGGYVTSTHSVTPLETLNVYVGGGGGGGNFNNGGNDAGGGGGGGGYSSLYRSSTALAIAAGGGGGGGARNATAGGTGGAGGGTTGEAGASILTSDGRGGGAGTPSTFGTAGTSTGNDGANGASLTGGAGGDGRTNDGTDGSGAAAGLASGGRGGSPNINTTRAGGGGGGAGLYGGAGGGATSSTNGAAGGGGGGGSSYTIAGATSVTNSVGSGQTPGQSSDTDRNGAADGGSGGAALGNGTAGDNGIVIITYNGGVGTSSAVNWAKFNTTSGTIDAANPGSGACSGWCTTSAYNLPSPRSNLAVVAYNGFLYAIGGEDSSCTTGNGTGDGGVCKTVYVAKLGANGEPQLWHPSDSVKSNWVYWYRADDLSSPRSRMKVSAYNNRLYLLGGVTSASSTKSIVSTSEIASISATGVLGTWSTSTALPYAAYGYASQIYNDRIYLIGGSSAINGAVLSTVYYSKISSTDGTLSSWQPTTALPAARMTDGGEMSSAWGAYMYVSGGCSAKNPSGYCTTIEGNTYVASINADGTIGQWNSVGSLTDTRTGHSVVAWRGYIYELGGCSAQNTGSGACTTTLSTINYGKINQDGDASTVDESVPSGTSPCSGGSPSGCDLPGTAYIGNMLTSSIIANGYLYVIGGCTNNTCSTTLGNVAYTAISSTGKTTAPTCNAPNNLRGNIWCVDTTNTVAGGIAAASPVVFGGVLYLVGGLDGGGNTDSIVRTTLNNDGSISSWSSQTMSGLSMNSVSYLFAAARANPASASSNPGNLFVFGGCTASSSAGCTAYSQNVYKCNIQTAGTIASCSTSGQLPIGTIPGGGTGLGIMSGTIYANYVYLIGGVNASQQDLKTVRYAKIDNSNNIVTAGVSGWTESPYQMAVGRRRAAAFGYNGYLYAVGGYEAATGVLADIEFIKINVSDGSLGTATDGFHVSAVQINQRWGLTVPVSNSFAYVIGGCTAGASPSGCTTRTNKIQTFQIYNNDSGAPSGYTTAANTYATNPNRIGASAAIVNGKLYVAGGCTSATDCTTAVNTVSYTTIDSYGGLGGWSNASGTFPSGAVRTWGKLVAAGGTLYYIGGQDSTSTNEQSTVYYGTPAGGGDVTTWTATTSLPAARTKFGAAVWNNRIYVVGGLDGSAAATSTVYVSSQQNSGGAISSWSTASTSFNVARSGPAVVAYANNLYVFGGYDGSNYLSDAQFSKISTADGTAGSWTYTNSLPMALSQGDAFAVNGYIYILGGRTSDTVCNPRTLVAPISANTTIASGNNPTGVGEWYETNQRYTGARYGNAAAYYDGKAYVIGGGCGSTLTYASPVTQQTTLLTQPQVAKYSRRIDTDTNVFPTKWLLNGVDNSIGARWQASYQSIYDSYYVIHHATFDQGTSGSPVTETTTAYDNCYASGSGTNTYSSSQYVTRGLSMKDSAPGGTNGSAACIDDFTAVSSRYDRFYVKYTTPPPSDTTIFQWSNQGAGGETIATLRIMQTTGNLQVRDKTTGETTQLALASGAWNRIEVFFDRANTTMTVRVYSGANLHSSTPTTSATYTINVSTATSFDRTTLGMVTGNTTAWDLYVDDHKASLNNWPGAAFPQWGQSTAFGDVTLGTLNTYTPKDASGTNSSYARWYDMFVSIDASQTFGYPEDVTRGPTIDDLSIFFTADPSKRLMHGRTFTGGEQQPLDTPQYSN